MIPAPFPRSTIQNAPSYQWPNHSGIDLSSRSGGAWEGDWIRASGDGYVRYAGRVSVPGGNAQRPGQAAGNAKCVVYTVGGRQVEVRYCHLKNLDGPGVGDRVGYGDRLAVLGNTGLSTGPHVHLEVWVDGVIQNPWPWFDFDNPVGSGSPAGGGSKPFDPEEDDMFDEQDRKTLTDIRGVMSTVHQLNRRIDAVHKEGRDERNKIRSEIRDLARLVADGFAKLNR